MKKSMKMKSFETENMHRNYAKDKRNKLLLNVYQKNARAISFYKREEFEIQHSGLDEATGEKDYVMTWQHK
mgnify:FL=1